MLDEMIPYQRMLRLVRSHLGVDYVWVILLAGKCEITAFAHDLQPPLFERFHTNAWLHRLQHGIVASPEMGPPDGYARQAGLETLVGIPVVAEDGTLTGGLFLADSRRRVFQESDLIFLSEAAAQIHALCALVAERNQFQELFEDGPVPMWVFDRATYTILDVNRTACYEYGYTREQFLKLTVRDIRPDEDLPLLDQVIERISSEDHYRGLFRHRTSDGSIRIVEIYSRPIRFQNRDCRLIYATNVTERYQAHQDLVEAKLKAEDMMRLKSTFLANMSHEIRTPLTAIMGFSEILKSEASGSHREYLELIHRSARRLLDTLNSVLQLAQLESGSVHPSVKPVYLKDVLDAVIPTLLPAARAKGLRIERLERESHEVLADSDVLENVITNLVANAVKFTEKGVIRIQSWRDEDTVHLQISDTGIGIDEAFLERLFRDFEQESQGLGRMYEGTGLGLALSRRLLELMNGTISVESRKGEGSSFEIQLPAVENASVA